MLTQIQRLTAAAAISFVSVATATYAQPVTFDRSWAEQRFSMLSGNNYDKRGNELGIASDGTVSMIYKKLDTSMAKARSASWSWQVASSVPPTNLSNKGGDDRNISIYFVFMAAEEAAALKENASIRALLGAKTARVLMYVYGGDHRIGSLVPSPYLGSQGKTKVMRPASTGSFSEQVDLASDFRQAFGEEPEVLVGLAISADSDDTETVIQATVSQLKIF